ncbi:hypothetical protein LCGC14_2417940 [marine sediment metagenome]|uniref:Uncharacterized protein n=1 Tax=marine sediment metagenome TaxID=412755 RepID=A0A0F9EJW0_9ZZZZ
MPSLKDKLKARLKGKAKPKAKKVKLERCLDCGGKGNFDDGEVECLDCGGKGKVEVKRKK